MLNLVNLKKTGKINDYAFNCLSKKLGLLPGHMQSKMIEDAITMTSIRVESEDDHRDFAYIRQNARHLAEELSARKLSAEELAKLSSIVYLGRKEKPIDTMPNFYSAINLALKKLDIPIKKDAYPVRGEDFINADNPHNIAKWMRAMRDIYGYMRKGLNSNAAFNMVTGNWDNMEKQDFKGWLRFYQEGAHEKYKTAQYLHLEGDGPPVLPMSHLKSKLPGLREPSMPNMSRFEDNAEILEEERREAVEKARKSAVSRLQAAEKLMTKPEVLKSLKGLDLNKWLESLHKLKRELQTLRLASITSVEDLIVRHGNILRSRGNNHEGFLLEKIAQAPPAPTVEELGAEQQLPEGQQVPAEGLEQEFGLPEEGLGLPEEELPEEDGEEAMLEFIQRMNNEYFEDESDIDDSDEMNSDDLVVTAQEVPRAFPEEPQPAIDVEEPIGELNEEMAPETIPHPLDDPLEHVEVTVGDVISRLESVADILRKREIPRQLGIIDLMLDRLGFVGFFPTLGEAHRSSLESNQYMITRIDDVLSKLRGAQSPESVVELSTTPEELQGRDDTLEQIRENLESEERKEKEKKERRRAEREAKEQAPAAQEQMARELRGPAEVEQTPPARVAR